MAKFKWYVLLERDLSKTVIVKDDEYDVFGDGTVIHS
jgi:hypothetical protein